MRFWCVSCLAGLLFIAETCSSLTVRIEAPKNHKENDKTMDKTKSKKSAETLYTLEDDFNKVKHHGGDGYEYYVPQKFYKPHAENHHFDNTEEIDFDHQHHVPVHENNNDENPTQLLAQHEHALRAGLAANPLLAAVFLGQTLGLSSTGAAGGFNHPAHLPINPYVALLLSHYGRYIQPAALFGRHQRGIYGYAAANNYHNNKPFGAYKIHEDAK